MEGRDKAEPLRLVVVGVFAVAEVALTVFLLDYFYTQFAWVESLLRLISLVIVLGLVRNSRHLSSDLGWIMLIVASPIVGTAAYLLLGANLLLGRTFRDVIVQTRAARQLLYQERAVLDEAASLVPQEVCHLRYLSESAGWPAWRNTGMEYFGLGEEGLPRMLEDLERAERFVFVEYFIIEPGQMWDAMLDVLARKAAQGVDVRVVYDDIGSVGTLPRSYARQLEGLGIKCEPFNPVNLLVNVFLNHRDHRKVMVIDGLVAYSGGINLADEYINAVQKYGHWKDNVIRVTGEAVWSYSVTFLTMWNALRHEDADWRRFRSSRPLPGAPDGFVCPYATIPFGDERVAQDVYLNIVGQARRYVWIMTPYLIIDTDMQNALILAARRGVDVRIVTPGVPDKRIIWSVTRSYYRALVAGGVRIYEYTPGFVHAKVMVSDDAVATVGTINLDYRSLYLHFENGTLVVGSQVVDRVRDDVAQALGRSHEMTLEESSFGILREVNTTVLRLVAPLL